MKRSLDPLFLVVPAALSLMLAGCTVQPAPSTAPSMATESQPIVKKQPTTAKVERRDIVGYRLMSGTVYTPPNAAGNAFAPVAAPVDVITVDLGERVHRGQTLMTLAVPGQDESYKEAKAAYESSVAAYNQALAQYEQPVRDAQRELDTARNSEKTARQSTIPGGDSTDLDLAIANRHALEDALKVAQAQARTNELPYKQQLAQAKDALNDSRALNSQGIVSSPISGNVVSITVAPGQQPSPKVPVARIVDLAALKVKANVGPDDVPYVKDGTEVIVLFGDFPDHKFTGRVTKLDTLPAETEGKTRYVASIDFANTDGMVKPDSIVHMIGIEMGHRNDALVAPVDAVGRDAQGKPVVQVEEKGNWKPIRVELGMNDGNFVEIKSGLSIGDTVRVVPDQGKWMFGRGGA